MRMTTSYIISATLLLAGCQGYAGKYQQAYEQQMNAETAAWNQVKAGQSTCAHGKDPRTIRGEQYLAYSRCMRKLVNDHVLPISMNPDLLQQYMATLLENGVLYSQGKIIYDQLDARGQVAQNEYFGEVMRRYNERRKELAAQDEADKAALRQALQGFEPVRPVYTTCSGYGRTVNCRSY